VHPLEFSAFAGIFPLGAGLGTVGGNTEHVVADGFVQKLPGFVIQNDALRPQLRRPQRPRNQRNKDERQNERQADLQPRRAFADVFERRVGKHQRNGNERVPSSNS
jgi:hypothetical protein